MTHRHALLLTLALTACTGSPSDTGDTSLDTGAPSETDSDSDTDDSDTDDSDTDDSDTDDSDTDDSDTDDSDTHDTDTDTDTEEPQCVEDSYEPADTVWLSPGSVTLQGLVASPIGGADEWRTTVPPGGSATITLTYSFGTLSVQTLDGTTLLASSAVFPSGVPHLISNPSSDGAMDLSLTVVSNGGNCVPYTLDVVSNTQGAEWWELANPSFEANPLSGPSGFRDQVKDWHANGAGEFWPGVPSHMAQATPDGDQVAYLLGNSALTSRPVGLAETDLTYTARVKLGARKDMGSPSGDVSLTLGAGEHTSTATFSAPQLGSRGEWRDHSVSWTAPARADGQPIILTVSRNNASSQVLVDDVTVTVVDDDDTGDTGQGGVNDPITIPNGSFETPALAQAGAFASGPPQGWAQSTNGSVGMVWLGQGSVFGTSPLQSPAEGNQALYLLDQASVLSDGIVTVQQGRTYNLYASAAARLDAGLHAAGSTHVVMLVGGSEVARTAFSHADLVANQGVWSSVSTAWNANFFAGELQVQLHHEGSGQIVVDNVRLIESY